MIPYSTIVSAVLTAIESEKDPRNLLISFELTRLVLSLLGNDEESMKTLEPFIEEIFENISCYYPIEFEPPKNDKFKITSKELKDKLNNCFVSSPLLSSLAFPFVLEKLTSVTAFTKKESLRTLQLMIREYPIQKVREFSEVIWNYLQNETFNSFDESVQTECVETIAQLCAVLTYNKNKFFTVQYDSISTKVINGVLEKCRNELEKDADTLTGILASHILCAIMKKNSSLCYTIIHSFVIEFCIGDIIHVHVKKTDEEDISDLSNEEGSIAPKLQLVISFLSALYDLMIENKPKIIDLLVENKRDIATAFYKGLESGLLLNKLRAIRLFKVLATHGYFNTQEIMTILGHIRIHYRKQNTNYDFMRDVLLELREVSNSYPYEAHECFAKDMETQYGDFKAWRQEEIKDTEMLNEDTYSPNSLYNVRSSLGMTVDMFLLELETFCRTKECINDMLYLCSQDFYTNIYVDNERQHIWTKVFLDAA